MRKLASACTLVALLALGGCSTIQTALDGGSVAQTAPQTTQDAEKALTVAHLAYQAVGVSLREAAIRGALRGADATTARTLYDKAGDLLDAADQADALANAPGVFAAVAQAGALIAQIDHLISGQ